MDAYYLSKLALRLVGATFISDVLSIPRFCLDIK